VRPTGVSIIAILQFIGGVLSILAGVLAALSLHPIQAVVAIVLGIIALILGVGMWTLQSWAWTGTLIIQGINILNNVINLLRRGDVSSIVGLIIAGIIVYYLTRPEVKEAFGK
jgi:uncharacterized membrane protein (DUF2068 family)